MGLTACKCAWERVELDPQVEPVLLRAAANVICDFPGHREEAVAQAETALF